MQDYLHGISFAWPTKRFKSDYFEALKSRRKFRKFWNRHLSFSGKISSAISICLDILQTTGVNNDNGELGALWVAEFEDEKYQDYSDDDGESDDDMSDATSNSANKQTDIAGSMETKMPQKGRRGYRETLPLRIYLDRVSSRLPRDNNNGDCYL
jgi:hypothetical protein